MRFFVSRETEHTPEADFDDTRNGEQRFFDCCQK